MTYAASQKERHAQTKQQCCPRLGNGHCLRQEITMTIALIGAGKKHFQVGSKQTLSIREAQIKCTGRLHDLKSEVIRQCKPGPWIGETGSAPAQIAAARAAGTQTAWFGCPAQHREPGCITIIVDLESLEEVYTCPVATCTERIDDVQVEVPTAIDRHVKRDILIGQCIGP